jgi:hypothetical protein
MSTLPDDVADFITQVVHDISEVEIIAVLQVRHVRPHPDFDLSDFCYMTFIPLPPHRVILRAFPTTGLPDDYTS